MTHLYHVRFTYTHTQTARETKLRQGNYKVVLILIMLIFRYTISREKGEKGNFLVLCVRIFVYSINVLYSRFLMVMFEYVRMYHWHITETLYRHTRHRSRRAIAASRRYFFYFWLPPAAEYFRLASFSQPPNF